MIYMKVFTIKNGNKNKEIPFIVDFCKSDEDAIEKIKQQIEDGLTEEEKANIVGESPLQKIAYFEYVEFPFRYEFTYIPFDLRFVVKTPYHERDGLKCFLEVKTNSQFAISKKIYAANFNFNSSQGTNALVKALKAAFDEFDIRPQEIVEAFKEEFRTVISGTRSKEISTLQPSREPKFLLKPFIMEKTVNLLYGHGSTGKSTLACYFAALLAENGYRVLYLDYENSTEDPIARTIKRINPNARNIFIRVCTNSLIDEIEQIYEEMKECNADIIIVDSAIKSMATDVFDPGQVSKYFLYIEKFRTTWLLISHVAKNNPDADPFGSVFFYNFSRNVWFAKKLESREDIIVQLVHKKSNYTKLQESVMFLMKEDERGFRIEKETPEKIFDKKQMILLVLEEGPATIEKLSQKLPAMSPQLIKKYLTQLKRERLVTNDKGTWQLLDGIEEEHVGTQH
jgi:KaiC/GvpD/RAD55 family RecA-like ATPase